VRLREKAMLMSSENLTGMKAGRQNHEVLILPDATILTEPARRFVAVRVMDQAENVVY
jgi:hypothetical protein